MTRMRKRENIGVLAAKALTYLELEATVGNVCSSGPETHSGSMFKFLGLRASAPGADKT